MSNVAFLGTGLLGAAFVEAAAKRGERITVWNRTAAKAKALEKFGVTVADTPANAVRNADRVHLVLRDDEIVVRVINELRPGLRPEAIIIDHTTTQPRLTAERATRLNREGVRYLHCPVFIGPAAARQGKGTVLASGPRHLFDQVRSALEQMAERVEYFGERPDLAAVYKLCGNAFIIGINATVADALTVGVGADVAPLDVLRVIGFFDTSAIIAGRGRSMANGEWAPSFELTMARKDLRLMQETAQGASLPLSMIPGLAERMEALIERGHGADDLAILAVDAMKTVTPGRA